MTIHLGDIPAGETVPIPFTTYGGTNGESITCSGLAVTDIEIYKDGSVTQRSSDAGYSLLDTDGIDFDSITGLHGFSIDLSDNTDSGFYAVGSWYWVVVSAITVDSQTVTFVAATFRIVAGESVAGVPEVDVTHINGSAASGSGTPDVNVVQISGDATAADNCESFFDGTGYAGTNNVIPSVTTVTGNVNGSVGSVTGAVGSVTGNVGGIAGTITTLDALDTAQDTQHSTTQTHLTDIKGGTWSSSTDTLEAIRDRGDAAWTTGAGGSDRLLMVDTTIATLASQTSFTLTAGSADDDAYNGCTIVIEDASTSTQKATGIVSDYTGSTKTVTLLYDPGVFTMTTSDKVYILAERGLKANSASNFWLNVTNAGLVDSNPKRWDDVLISSTSPFDGLALETSVQGLVTTVGAAGVGLTEAGGTGDHLTAIPWNASWDAEVQSECADALTAFGWTSITISAVSGAVGSVTGNVGGNVTGSVGSLATQAKAEVNAEVDDVLNTDATTEPTSAPAATASLGTKLGWVFARLRNKLTQTATTETLFQDDTTTTLSTSTVSDDGTTYTRGEHS